MQNGTMDFSNYMIINNNQNTRMVPQKNRPAQKCRPVYKFKDGGQDPGRQIRRAAEAEADMDGCDISRARRRR